MAEIIEILKDLRVTGSESGEHLIKAGTRYRADKCGRLLETIKLGRHYKVVSDKVLMLRTMYYTRPFKMVDGSSINIEDCRREGRITDLLDIPKSLRERLVEGKDFSRDFDEEAIREAESRQPEMEEVQKEMLGITKETRQTGRDSFGDRTPPGIRW